MSFLFKIAQKIEQIVACIFLAKYFISKWCEGFEHNIKISLHLIYPNSVNFAIFKFKTY